MHFKTKAIVLHTVRYQEKSLIVRCFTEAFGITSYFIKNAFSKNKNTLNVAYFQPLTLLEINATHKNKGNLEYITNLSLLHPYQNINNDFSKSTVFIFLAELYSIVLKEEKENSSLFSFLEESLIWFDTHPYFADFHLFSMMGITKFLGFYPNTEDIRGTYFNPIEGKFMFTPEHLCFNEDESFLFKKLLTHNYVSDIPVFNGNERKLLIRMLLRYFELHTVGFRQPLSLDILSEIYTH